MYPPAWIGPRRSIEPFELHGVRVPGGVLVNYCSWASHHLAEVFPEPFRFRPERFTEEARAALPKGAYVPFGGGSRTCIGMRFGLLEVRTIAAAILERFWLELAEPERRAVDSPDADAVAARWAASNRARIPLTRFGGSYRGMRFCEPKLSKPKEGSWHRRKLDRPASKSGVPRVRTDRAQAVPRAVHETRLRTHRRAGARREAEAQQRASRARVPGRRAGAAAAPAPPLGGQLQRRRVTLPPRPEGAATRSRTVEARRRP